MMNTHQECKSVTENKRLGTGGLWTNLSVCDGNDIGGDVGRHITSLGLDHREGSEGAASEVVVHLSGSLQQTGVQVEHVTRVGLTTRRTTQQQGHLTVGHSLTGRSGEGLTKMRCVVMEKINKKNSSGCELTCLDRSS